MTTQNSRQLNFKVWNIDTNKFEQHKFNLQQDQSVVCQDTGLIDSSGIKVFEKDIIKFFWYFHETMAIVNYKQGAFYAEILHNHLGTLTNQNTIWLHELVESNTCKKTFYVIGNAYANPKLLQPNSSYANERFV
jgi:uncharacterized phage protein (TIGR01671 family)